MSRDSVAISIIVPAYNNAADLRESLAANNGLGFRRQGNYRC
jgi:hypothetical protein